MSDAASIKEVEDYLGVIETHGLEGDFKKGGSLEFTLCGRGRREVDTTNSFYILTCKVCMKVALEPFSSEMRYPRNTREA